MRYATLLLGIISFFTPVARSQYFPKGSLDTHAYELKSEWYSAQLTALQEPSLLALAKDPKAESYRFLWLRTFRHPIAVRLDRRPDGTGLLTTKVASGAGGYSPGTLTDNTSRVLTAQEVHHFLSELERLKFWTLPNPVNDQAGTDGSQWVIEGVKNGRYHVVDRWTPTKGPVKQLGDLLAFGMAKLTIPQNDVY